MSPIKVLVLIALWAGCAMVQNTPQQDATHALFAECKAETNSSAKLQQVYPNGTFTWVKGSDTTDDGMKDCMVRKGQKFDWVNTPRGAWGGSSGSAEKTKTIFEHCKTETGYASATLTELNQDGGFRYRGDDREANKAFTSCLKDKGLRIY